MKIYLRILEFAKPYRFYIILSICASFLYVITNGLSLWIIGSLLSSVMSGGAIINDSVSPVTFTDKINRLIFSFIDTNNKIELLKFLSLMLLVSF